MIYIAAFRRGPPHRRAFDSVWVRLGSLTASWGENVMNQRHYFGDDAALLFVIPRLPGSHVSGCS